MSHFTLMVIGPNPEQQLKPFGESREVEPYNRYLSEQRVADARRALAMADDTPFTQEQLTKYFGRDDVQVDAEGKLFYVSTFNPQFKWDWFQLGGRWSGFFKAREGAVGLAGDFADEGHLDQLLLQDIDFEGMRAAAKMEAEEYYNEVEARTEGLEVPPWTWPELLARHGGENPTDEQADAASEEFNEHPWVAAVRDISWGECPVELFCARSGGRETFLARQIDARCATFAVLKFGEWHERGSMSWFGCASGEQPRHEWSAKVKELLQDLPGDTLISLYDCHI